MPPSLTNEQPSRAVLDTDIFSLLFHEDALAGRIRSRIAALTEGGVCISAITAEETLRGALARIREQETRNKPQTGYALLTALVLELSAYPILPFDAAAEVIYRALPAAIKRAGSADCKIAAIAQAQGATVIMRNVRHFSAIGQAPYADWTR
jgi:predicted nucleic acid-binding protein